MKNRIKYLVPGLAVVLSLSIHAHAKDNDKHRIWATAHPHRAPQSAPEVDPSLAIGGFTLLAGTLTVMRSRRRT